MKLSSLNELKVYRVSSRDQAKYNGIDYSGNIVDIESDDCTATEYDRTLKIGERQNVVFDEDTVTAFTLQSAAEQYRAGMNDEFAEEFCSVKQEDTPPDNYFVSAVYKVDNDEGEEILGITLVLNFMDGIETRAVEYFIQEVTDPDELASIKELEEYLHNMRAKRDKDR